MAESNPWFSQGSGHEQSNDEAISDDAMSDDDVLVIPRIPVNYTPEQFRLPRQRRTESRLISAEKSSEFEASSFARRAASRESIFPNTDALFHVRIGSSASASEHRNLASRSDNQQENGDQDTSESRDKGHKTPSNSLSVSVEENSINERRSKLAALSQQVYRNPSMAGTRPIAGPQFPASAEATRVLHNVAHDFQPAPPVGMLPLPSINWDGQADLRNFDNAPILGPTSRNFLGSLHPLYREEDENRYFRAFARFAKKFAAAIWKFIEPKQSQAATPQFYQEAFHEFIDEYKVAKSKYDLKHGDIEWEPTPRKVFQAALSQQNERPSSTTQIPLGTEQSFFHHDHGFLPPRINNESGSFFECTFYHQTAGVYRAAIEGGMETIVVYMHGVCWGQKERTGFGVWFGEDSLFNAKKLEFIRERRPRVNEPEDRRDCIQYLLVVLDEWMWVYEMEGWTLNRKRGRNSYDANRCPEVFTLLGKLADLRKGEPSIRVSFRFVVSRDLFGATDLVKSTKFMRERNPDGS
ncbi:hypothetical protein N431DRAFT_456754 [Stipitochalara longipes BDJ]|nr:hypothetical protein N431DRAFT_456754 [Stipitochalara longipes BDJ]